MVLCAPRRESKRERITTNRALDTTDFPFFEKNKQGKETTRNNVVKFSRVLCVTAGCVVALCIASPFMLLSFLLSCCLVFLHMSCTIDAHDVWCGGFFKTIKPSRSLSWNKKSFLKEQKFLVCLVLRFKKNIFFRKKVKRNFVSFGREKKILKSRVSLYRFELWVFLLLYSGGSPILVVWYTQAVVRWEKKRYTRMTIKISYVHVPWDINMFSFFGWGHLYIYVWWSTHFLYRMAGELTFRSPSMH